MKFSIKILTLIVISTMFPLHGGAKPVDDSPIYVQVITVDGEEQYHARIPTIYVFPNRKYMNQYNKLANNVRKVYPIAKAAKRKLAIMERELLNITDKKAQKAYVKKMEKELKAEYTPVLKKMTFSQGKILIKLIDRETDRTSYSIVKELRGGFSAALWQGIARLFGANLKDTYDAEGEDKLIEEMISLYEKGLL